jgi:hypothetical protein
MEKTLHFTNGQISADIRVKLRGDRLSISGVVYEGERLLRSESNLISGGQCLDEARSIIPEKLAEVWERWHLNDMRAGTHRQEEALRPVKDTFDRLNWYDEACNYLSSIDLLFDGDYKYGSAWLTEELPADVIEYIESL